MNVGIWHKIDHIENEEIRVLSEALPHVLRSSLAPGTTNKYERGWRGCKNWSASKEEVLTCPGDPFYVSIYLTSLIFSNGTKGAIIDAFYGIRWGHHLAGFQSPTDHPTVKMAFEGAQRLCSKPIKKKDPMLTEMVKSLMDTHNSLDSSLHDLRFLVVIELCYTGFLRIDELLSTQLKHVSIKDKHMEIFLAESKTDKSREGSTVFIARTDTAYCPVSLVEKYLNQANMSLDRDKEAFLICRFNATKKGLKPHPTLGIGYNRTREVFKQYVKPFEDEGFNLGLHSMRAGGATVASENDVPGPLMDIHGRWKNEKSKAGYIKHSLKKRLLVTQSLGL